MEAKRMAQQPIYLTSEGIAKLEEKLEYLKSVRRGEVAERIKAAIALGDLSENSEYEDAKNEQAFLEGEIMSLEATLRNAELIEEDEGAADVVNLGCTVRIRDLDTDKDVDYVIVGSNEADPFNGKISNESPVGAALLGHSIGDSVEVVTPGRTRHIQIITVHNG